MNWSHHHGGAKLLKDHLNTAATWGPDAEVAFRSSAQRSTVGRSLKGLTLCCLLLAVGLPCTVAVHATGPAEPVCWLLGGQRSANVRWQWCESSITIAKRCAVAAR